MTSSTRRLLLLAMALLWPGSASSQGVSLEVLAGASFSVGEWEGDFRNTDPRTGLVAGIGAEIPTHPQWSIRPGLFYVEKGTRGHLGSTILDFDLAYLEMPIRLEFRSPIFSKTQLRLFGGPTISVSLSCESRGSSQQRPFDFDCDEEEDLFEYKSFDYGLAIGGGLVVNISPTWDAVVETSFNFGLGNALEVQPIGASMKNRTFTIAAGLSYEP